LIKPSSLYWKERTVLVTGGASFIGSHLVDELVQLGADVTVVDNLSTGKLENLKFSRDKIRFYQLDLEYSHLRELLPLFRSSSVVFHLAATHGGRGYIDRHPADVCSNFSIDHHVLEASCSAGVEKVVFASSACVYPPRLQDYAGSDYLLREEDSDPANLENLLSADLEYGWAKLMGEMQLRAFIKQYGLRGCCMRFVTAYGPRENESHAIAALIYKAFQRADPYVIWGTGDQERDFTYVSDIVAGTIIAAERIDDGMALNLGTGQRRKMSEVANQIFQSLNWRPRNIVFDTTMPTGVASRALDIRRARQLLKWEPRISFNDGLANTIQWYTETHSYEGRVNNLLLTERA
jgi:nucleoside-diphosphate-sugar epimerase